MSNQRFSVKVSLSIVDAETKVPFASTTQEWESMSLASVVAVEKALYNAQGTLLQQSISEITA